MKKLTREQILDLKMSFSVWQQDYDPVHDKEQHDMFALGVAAMNEMLAAMDSESESQPEGAIGVFRVGSKSGQEPPVVLTEAVKNLPEGVYWLYATHQPTAGQRREWMARGVDSFGEYHNFSDKQFAQHAANKFADKIRSGEVDL